MANLKSPCHLNGLKGKSYYSALKTFLEEVGPDIIIDAILMKPLTILDIGRLSLKHKLNFKAVCEWLEETGVIPTGAYHKMTERGIRAHVVYQAARELNK